MIEGTSTSIIHAKTNKFQTPDTLIILFVIGLFTAVATYFIPVGSFKQPSIEIPEKHIKKTAIAIDPTTFSYHLDQSGQFTYKKAALFASGDEIGIMNFPFNGLTSGDKNSAATGIIMFMLIIGGTFGIIMRTGTIDNAILRLIDRTRGNEHLFIPAMFMLFSAGGAIFGMGEEVMAFALIIAPLMIRLGYDSIVTVMVTFAATQIGFATSWMNPFCVVIAQGIAEVPILSGSGLRIILWLAFTLFGIIFTMIYAYRIKKNPIVSYSYHSDAFFREQLTEIQSTPLKISEKLILLNILFTCVWVVWGVIEKSWFIAEIASQFFVMGVVTALITILFKLNNLTLNDMVVAFKEGAAMMIGPALLVGFSKGILLLLGSHHLTEPSVLNTILHTTADRMAELNQGVAVWAMLLFQAIFDFFVPSGSGQAALTMPLMAPLGDLIGVSRQVTVLAFQLGDGFANIVIPTSAALMGTLGACRLDWSDWIRFCWRFFSAIFALASIVVILAHYFGY